MPGASPALRAPVVVLDGEVQVEEVPPTCGLDVRTRPERGHQQPDGGDQPDQADQREADMDDRAVERCDDPPSGCRPRVDHAAGENAQVTDEVRKRRTLKIRIGMRRTSITTATADP